MSLSTATGSTPARMLGSVVHVQGASLQRLFPISTCVCELGAKLTFTKDSAKVEFNDGECLELLTHNGSIYLTEQMGEEAEVTIRPVAEAQPDDFVAKDLLATSLIQQGKIDAALVLLTEVAEQQDRRARSIRRQVLLLRRSLCISNRTCR